ncbi:MAG: hypothetical protein OEL84_00840 [Nitrosopumilus sp.]|nr:hypothetical protein [Nitrosopumilus sp.]MDH5568713.1 hypothetical protein [Nitrosopumilus sp.]
MSKINTKKFQTKRSLAANDYFSIISPNLQTILNDEKHTKKENIIKRKKEKEMNLLD